MIRVLHCVVGMNYGGYETLLMNIYRCIDRSKIQFDFMASLPGKYDEEIRGLGGEIYYLPFITKVGPFLYKKNVLKFLRNHPEYHIVHSHMDKFSGLIMECAAKTGVKIRIAHSHSVKNEGGLLYQIVKNYYGLKINPFATDLFACSRQAAEWLFKERAKEAQIVHNGVDLERFHPDALSRREMRLKLGINDDFVIGHVGRFCEQKNHSFLIEAFEQIARKEEKAKLLLIGSGDLSESIKKTVQLKDLVQQVVFCGESDQVECLLRAMDVFVFPSISEGLGLALVEAQACGVPCVASEGVPKQADVSGKVRFLSLESGAQRWSDEICALRDAAGFDCKNEIIQKGYDIKQTAEWLENFYLKAW